MTWLLRYGANVVAIDEPGCYATPQKPTIWRRLVAAARTSRGQVRFSAPLFRVVLGIGRNIATIGRHLLTCPLFHRVLYMQVIFPMDTPQADCPDDITLCAAAGSDIMAEPFDTANWLVRDV